MTFCNLIAVARILLDVLCLLVTSGLRDYIYPSITTLAIPKSTCSNIVYQQRQRTVTVLRNTTYKKIYMYVIYCLSWYCYYFIQDNVTPVWKAAFYGHIGALNVLIRAKADVNAAKMVSLIFIFMVLNFTTNKF